MVSSEGVGMLGVGSGVLALAAGYSDVGFGLLLLGVLGAIVAGALSSEERNP